MADRPKKPPNVSTATCSVDGAKAVDTIFKIRKF